MKRLFLWFLVLLQMGIIFYFSHQPAEVSRQQSAVISEGIGLIKDGDCCNIGIFPGLVRKGAHFGLYTILGLLLKLLLSRKKKSFSFVAPWLVGTIYGISDEVHQCFVPGRGMSLFDMIIDSAGVLLGVCIGCLVLKSRQNML